ncbi:MAG: NAD-dependent epimerase/dehydratase family protein [Cytophagales bacterium]|nr:NAD-dependent epimerase/dehydratase family protein [Cytophagales bacterium]
MRIVVIGGTGHVGTFLVPRLINDGHDVISISRQFREPYLSDDAWTSVEQIKIDRTEEEENNTFGSRIRELNADVVIDMICFKPESARMLVNALAGKVKHFLHCGTIWVHGHSFAVPTLEHQPKSPFGAYGIDKAKIEAYLLEQAVRIGFPVTLLHPGHIVGPGWVPVNPAGNFNLEVFSKLASGQGLALPNMGMETLHHVHADDVAQCFQCAVNNFDNAVGEHFHVVSDQAMTLRGYAEALAEWYGFKADLRYLPWQEWKATVSEEDARSTWDHIAHSPNCSIEKAKRLLNYRPSYSSLEAIKEALVWLREHGRL